MNKIIKKVLKNIENNGFEAYIVGGYVRDLLLGNISWDIDICTNALPKDLHRIFPVNNNSNNYGGFNLKIKKYNIDITTYREELKYENRKPVEIKYIDNLLKDLERRDFTINAICMNSSDKIIDLVGGINDIENRVIRMIGNIDKKLKEDPLRILRAIRFSTILNFQIDKYLEQGIIKNSYLISNLSMTRIKSELNKILLSPNFEMGLKLLKEYKILSILKLNYDNIIYVNDINGMWAQLEFTDNFTFTKQEKENIIKIREVMNYGKIDNNVLYNYGLYISQIAGNIIGIPKNEINNKFNKMQITNKGELSITSKEIVSILNIPEKNISNVVNKLILLILDNKLNNSKREIKKYLILHKEEFTNE